MNKKIKLDGIVPLTEIMDYENGVMSEIDEIKMFSRLLKSKLVWKLQGFYGRAAADMITSGILNSKGEILINLNEVY
jgi:hypothetical protein